MRLTDVVRGHIGTGEKRLRDIFGEARRNAPSIVFIDEFQAIFTSRTNDGPEENSGVGISLTSALMGCFDDLNTWYILVVRIHPYCITLTTCKFKPNLNSEPIAHSHPNPNIIPNPEYQICIIKE